jgi:parvulin-like peptidyl-prolyl isomerase
LKLAHILLLAAGLRPEATAVATYRDGVVTRQDVESWNAYLRAEGRSLRPGPLKAQVERIVALRTLDRRFEQASPQARRRSEAQLALWRLELGQSRLRDAMRTAAGPSDAEVRAIFEADPAAYGEPQHWQLENIFKRYPEGATDQDKARLRAAMEEIRRRAVAGEDFQQLAKQESESETRLRGGRLGAVSLDHLAPEVAAVVSVLKKGDISPVFAAPGGLALLRCTLILPAKEPSLEEARPRIARPRGEDRFQKAWGDLAERIRAEQAASLRPEAILGASVDDVVASFASGGSKATLSRGDFEVFLSAHGLEPRTSSLEMLKDRLAERVLLDGLAREAEARGLLRQAGDDDLSRWKGLELHGRAVEESFPIQEPTEPELRAQFAAHPDDYLAPARSQLEALKLRLELDRPRSLYERARKLGDRLAAGQGSFDEAVKDLSPPAERVDLGWMTDDQVWMLGLNVDTAVKDTPAGRTSRLAQEGKDLYLVHVLAREAERTLSFEEAREDVVKGLREKARQQEVHRLVEDQKVVLAE